VTSGRLQKLLVCPTCRGGLEFNQEIVCCRECGQDYPIRDGVPVLIAPDSLFYRQSEPKAVPSMRDSLPGWLRRLMKPYLDYNPPLAIWIDRSMFRHLNECSPQMQILNLGAGVGQFDEYLQPHLNFINLDVSLATKDLDVAADAHSLPFANESLDAVYSNAVLEHVQRPWRVAEEIHRVLRPGGKIFINVPFLTTIHDTHDYFRFTDKGLQILFSRFDEIDSGISVGPSSFLGPFFVEYVSCFIPGRHLKALLRGPLSLLAWPIKYLDLLIRGSADLRLTADAFFYVGSKKT
jgi:uncharacterized protein YbaR (Trm112 family)